MAVGRTSAAAGAAALVVLLGAAPLPAAELASHRGVYVMGLKSTKPSSGISGASGTMTYKFTDACDGWVVENRTVLRFAYGDSAPVDTTWEFVTWEAKDGHAYRFYVRSTRDGEVSEQVDGSAELGPDGSGIAKFSQPSEMTVKLPKAAMFPTAHTVALLMAAQARQRVFTRVVFDGSGTDGPFEVNAVVGSELAPAVPDELADQPLLETPSWRIRMAFFPIGSSAAEPDYEVGLRYHLNGVAQEVVQDFGTFSLKGRLETLERLPKPDC